MLQTVKLNQFKNSAGTSQDIEVTYQFFGKDSGNSSIVLVTHALTGNSEVTGIKGWWNELVGPEKLIDSNRFCILSIDMPGNGFDGKPENLITNYRDFTLKDVANIYIQVLERLNISEIFAGIGGSIGGALLWEIAALRPRLFQHLIPVATDYKTSQWVKALCTVQDHILNNSAKPLQDARMHAMTFYRTAESFKLKFSNNQSNQSVSKWLEYHGNALEARFSLSSYKLLNHLLTTIDISNAQEDHLQIASQIKSIIHIITVNSDQFFLASENWETYVNLSLVKENIEIFEINSVHGHDAFLIEHAQISNFLQSIFNSNTNNETSKHRALWSR